MSGCGPCWAAIRIVFVVAVVCSLAVATGLDDTAMTDNAGGFSGDFTGGADAGWGRRVAHSASSRKVLGASGAPLAGGRRLVQTTPVNLHSTACWNVNHRFIQSFMDVNYDGNGAFADVGTSSVPWPAQWYPTNNVPNYLVRTEMFL